MLTNEKRNLSLSPGGSVITFRYVPTWMVYFYGMNSTRYKPKKCHWLNPCLARHPTQLSVCNIVYQTVTSLQWYKRCALI